MSAISVSSLGQAVPARTDQSRRWLLGAVAAATFLGSLHHLDHVIRGNHAGWPLSPEVNAFSYSLGVYPLLLIGLIALLRGRLWPGYWLGIALLGLLTSGDRKAPRP